MRIIFISIILLTISAANILAQSILEVVCSVETSNSTPIISAKAELYEDGNKVKTVNTDSKGKISFNLNYNKSYKIIISKNGMIQKRIDFKTNITTEDQRNLRKEFAMTLVEDCEGADVSAFKEPADIITYDKGFGNFVSDKSYFEKMQSKFANAYRNLDKCKQDKFQDKKTQANQQFSQGNFEEAIKLYEEALKVFPNDGATNRQISQAKKNITKQQANNQLYEQIITEADQLLSQNSLNAAKQKYSEAARLNASSSYPQEKLNEIQEIIAQQTAEDQKRKATNDEYNRLIKQGNAAIAAKNYPMAQQLFEKAVIIKPNDALATQKIAVAQQALQRQEQQNAENTRINNAYQEAIDAAETAMQQSNYIKAQELYQSAIALKPSEAFARQKLVEAQKLEALKQKNILAQQKAEVNKSYNDAIAEANSFLSQKLYTDAIKAFEQAMTIKPSDKYAQQQIVAINNLIIEESQAKQVAIEQKYNKSIYLGDSKKLNKEYSEAISAYKQALQIKPSDPSATVKLEEAQKLLSDKTLMNKEEQEIRAKYNKLIKEGDVLFSSKNYTASKTKYEQAIVIYSTEQYPKNQIAKMDNITSKNLRETKYNSIITDADGLFNNKSWKEAKVKYSEAALVLPEKTYPQQKINEINAIHTEQVRLDANKGEIENNYNQTIALADKYFNDKNYSLATNEYRKSLRIKPEEQYPSQQIEEIELLISNKQQLAAQKTEQKRKYNESIITADEKFKLRDYTNAKIYYNEALGFKPGDIHANSQIQRIDQINAEKLSSQQQQQQQNSKYKNLIEKADNLYSTNKLKDSRLTYLSALEVIPGQEYPRTRIRKIDEKLRIIAINNAAIKIVSSKPKTTTKTAAPTTTNKTKLADLKFTSESEKAKYLNNLKANYNEGVTKEIYSDNRSTTNRYIIIRNGEVNEFREILFKWGGAQYRINGKPTNSFHLNSQVKPRDGESYKEVKI